MNILLFIFFLLFGYYLGFVQGTNSMAHTWLFSIYIARIFTGESPSSCMKHSIKLVEEATKLAIDNADQHGNKYKEMYSRRNKELKQIRRNNN